MQCVQSRLNNFTVECLRAARLTNGPGAWPSHGAHGASPGPRCPCAGRQGGNKGSPVGGSELEGNRVCAGRDV